MQVQPESPAVHHNFERIANLLRYAGWGNFVAQLGLAIAAVLCLVFAISGRTIGQTVTPGIGISIF